MSEKSSTTTILKRQLQWMKASGMRVKTVRYDNAKEQMAPLKDMCWANGVLVEYVAPYTATATEWESRKTVSYGFKESKCNVRHSKTRSSTQNEIKKGSNTIFFHNGKHFNQ
jgi:hypothetical protein